MHWWVQQHEIWEPWVWQRGGHYRSQQGQFECRGGDKSLMGEVSGENGGSTDNFSRYFALGGNTPNHPFTCLNFQNSRENGHWNFSSWNSRIRGREDGCWRFHLTVSSKVCLVSPSYHHKGWLHSENSHRRPVPEVETLGHCGQMNHTLTQAPNISRDALTLRDVLCSLPPRHWNVFK